MSFQNLYVLILFIIGKQTLMWSNVDRRFAFIYKKTAHNFDRLMVVSLRQRKLDAYVDTLDRTQSISHMSFVDCCTMISPLIE